MIIGNKQERDPKLTSLKGVDGFYSADKIVTALEKYDLIIYTPEGVYDTSRYNQSKKDTTGLGFETSLIDNGNNGVSLQLIYNPLASGTSIQQHKLNKTCRAVLIPERTIEKVIVKGRRNFLGNRKPEEK